MKIAFLVSALSKQAPIFVIKDLITGLLLKDDIYIEVFYLDDITELDMPVLSKKISVNNIRVLESFDIVHSHGIRPDMLTNLLSKSVIKISTQHNIIYEQYLVIYNKLLAKSIEFLWINSLRDKNAIVAIGQAATKYYRSKLPNKYVLNINNGRAKIPHILSTDEINFFKHLQSKYKIIGACTRVVKLKGHAQIIKALKFLPNYCFVLVGKGKYLQNLIDLSRQEDVEDRCFFIGHKDFTSGYLEYFDVYALTSYSESVSIALIEAASASKRIICSDIPSNRYLFDSNEVVFFELDNISSLVAGIKQLFNYEYSENVYQKYLSCYTKEKMVDQYYTLYLDMYRRR